MLMVIFKDRSRGTARSRSMSGLALEGLQILCFCWLQLPVIWNLRPWWNAFSERCGGVAALKGQYAVFIIVWYKVIKIATWTPGGFISAGAQHPFTPPLCLLIPSSPIMAQLPQVADTNGWSEVSLGSSSVQPWTKQASAPCIEKKPTEVARASDMNTSWTPLPIKTVVFH